MVVRLFVIAFFNAARSFLIGLLKTRARSVDRLKIKTGKRREHAIEDRDAPLISAQTRVARHGARALRFAAAVAVAAAVAAVAHLANCAVEKGARMVFARITVAILVNRPHIVAKTALIEMQLAFAPRNRGAKAEKRARARLTNGGSGRLLTARFASDRRNRTYRR